MTKAELVEEVARAAELNKRDAEVIVETVFDSIISALHKGEKVELRGFGSFRTRERGPRRGRNPKTGEPVDVPAKRVPYFKPGKELKEFFTEGSDSASSSEGASGSDGAGEGAQVAPAPTEAAVTATAPPAEAAASESGAARSGGSDSMSETPTDSGSATSEASGGGNSSSGSAD
jgi:integration host factor subunit beta